MPCYMTLALRVLVFRLFLLLTGSQPADQGLSVGPALNMKNL